MLRECFYHVSNSNWAYAYTKEKIHLRFRTKRDDVTEIAAVTGDKYDWDRTYKEYPMLRIASDAYFDYWEATVKPKYKRLTYGFRITAGTETVWMVETGVYNEQPYPPGGYYDFPYIHEIDLFTAPEWAKSAIFYQIFPDRFANGDLENDPEGTEQWGDTPTTDNSFGGDLQGIIDKLDYIVNLGVNAIYLTPVFESPSNHKYDTLDYKKVDPQFGDNAKLKELVEACHDRGIRVMLDAVFNHCSEHFALFQDVVKKGEKSKYADWFHVREFPIEVKDGIPTYDTFGFFQHMPKFNTANPEVKEYLLDVAEYWIKEIKIDGWRLDVANEIDHHFWRDFRKIVKAANPEAYIVGEVWNDSLKWLLGDQFDSVMNYPFSNKVLEFFSSSYMDGYTFANSMGFLLMRYPQQTNEVVFNLLCSHDTPRVLTCVGEDKRRLKLCVVFLLTYIGTPCIFYGDEIGLTGGGDPDCRKCMVWEPEHQDNELYDFYKLLIALRKDYDVLRQGGFRFLKADSGDSRIIYERIDDKMHFTVWMNNTEEETVLSHPMETDDWKDALSQEDVVPENGMMNIKLDPLGYRILYRWL
ncbi:NplT [Paenibacillus mucilaginosus 3016]|uniref:NplT n=2 Tax=Paenibacillus mucilaginosus TaxID=61624 RepID=H6NRY2_9BACL|nr:alpha-glycosidase [Paenibacillus mucilaginosus]AFC33611.1 NplT [Paenibacillus mucilaginosus 3016]AFH65938.1 cyclomaltodextrinase [Paenibacillus mucilaginosus K02]WFA22011.1 alpha-glycosidase [Paenibacillus mucilaginosus]